ncbi:MAG: SDR family NAD(P)-dependent oxidoreductase [Treponema sp.]|jgi:3-oxoacyl-[acyl-carrier protein] reductase|nr:SDR family NAD(P)-dependent oxidoreductase [Treponema sp.]
MDLKGTEEAKNAFAGRKALVIGGSGGIGREVALALAGRGARLTVHGGSSRERLERTLGDIRDSGGEAEGFLCPADLPGAAERILARAPDPDILVCAWGPFKRGSLEALDADFWQTMVSCNLAFPGTIVSLALDSMIKKKWGRILLFGGTNTDTIRGFASTAAYSAAKTGLGVIAKSAAKTAGKQGITCNVICPGLTDTEYLDEEARAYNRERNPLGKALRAAEIALTALGILENPAINGAVVPVDRGLAL